MNDLITVCLSAFNSGKYIGEAIESILNQSYTNFELFVVDDKSNDNTLEIAKKYLYDSRLKIMALDKNIGTFAAKNLVLKKYAKGDYWSTHDADDFSHKDKFLRELEFIKNNDLDGCGCAINELYEDGIKPRIPSEYKLEYDKNNDVYVRKNYYPERVTLDNISVDINDLPKLKIFKNGTLMVKMSALKTLGGFDDTRMGGDSEFLWRFVKFFKFGNLQEIHYTRRFHHDSLTQNKDVGHLSNLRKEYAKKAFLRHRKGIEILNNKGKSSALEFSTYDMYFPEVNYKIYEE